MVRLRNFSLVFLTSLMSFVSGNFVLAQQSDQNGGGSGSGTGQSTGGTQTTTISQSQQQSNQELQNSQPSISQSSSGGQQAQTIIKPNYELKVGARNSTIRNIGSFQTDSALIFPNRLVADTTHSKALKKSGAFFFDKNTHELWFYDGKHFSSGMGLYTTDGSLQNTKNNRRIVDLNDKQLIFSSGKVMVCNKDSVKASTNLPISLVVNSSSYKGDLRLNGIRQ